MSDTQGTIQNKQLIDEARSYVNYLLQDKNMTVSRISQFTGVSRIVISLFWRGRIDLESVALKVMELKEFLNKVNMEESAWQINN